MDQELTLSPIIHMNSLKINQLHILALKVMRHICSPNLLTLLVKLLPLRGCHREFRVSRPRSPKSYFYSHKLWFILYVLRTIRTTPPPQQFNLFLGRQLPSLYTMVVTPASVTNTRMALYPLQGQARCVSPF